MINITNNYHQWLVIIINIVVKFSVKFVYNWVEVVYFIKYRINNSKASISQPGSKNNVNKTKKLSNLFIV